MNYNYSEIKDLLDACSSFVSGSFPHSYLYFDITRPCNQPIVDLLLESGYWNWAPYRSKRLVSYHQIIAFLFISRKKSYAGVELEIHHKDGNTRNNHPGNLVYLSADDHVLVTKCQRRMAPFKIKVFNKYKGVKTNINARGTKLVNWFKFIMSVIAETIKASVLCWGVGQNVICNVKSVMAWAAKWVHKQAQVFSLRNKEQGT